MRLTAIVAAALFAAAIAAPASADTFTYQGTIGKSDVVVELSTSFETADADSFGRYFYPRVGIDIPLRGMDSTDGTLVLAEELSCAENPCEINDHGIVENPPLGARWTLATTVDGATITGTWAYEGRELPVTLNLVDQLPFEVHADPTPAALARYSSVVLWDLWVSGGEPPPYERLKLESVELDQGPVVELDGSTYRNVFDPRTLFAIPRIVALADGSSPDAANRALASRHMAMNAEALNCMAMEYGGMGWTPWTGGGGGSLGGWEDEHVEVHHLSPTVMTWTESGSVWCGGASPYNHSVSHTLDVRTGEKLHMGRIFQGWVARTWDGKLMDSDTAFSFPDEVRWGPDEELTAYVTTNRKRSDWSDFEEECGIDNLIPDYLSIGFASGDNVVFGLSGSSQAACEDDLLKVPLADIRHLLTPEAARWFPSLAQ